ncbi:MAG: enoyl-CoA hydratase/isomerase family protein [Arenicellales bacterium]
MSKFTTLLVETLPDGPVLCRFNRPQTRNAINRVMVDELHRLLDELASRETIPVIIFAGNHKSFVSGADISELRDRRRQDALIKINSGLFHKIETFPSPTIAAVEGWALGGGCELAMACDIRVVGKSARIGQPEVSLGIIPGAGGCIRLPKLVGIGKAREMIFTGMILDATEARVLGWANHLVKDEEIMPVSIQIATQIMSNSAIAVTHAKKLISQGARLDDEAAMDLEAQSQAVLFEHPDKYQRMTAFLDRKNNREDKN